LKRIFDILFSLVFLILFSPLFIFIVLTIKMFDRGPVFYRAPRVGQNGTFFPMFKFRTMVVNADRIGGSSTPDNDPRITVVGRLLRKYKLDEFPQLFNVIKGDMSIVGPRPEVKEYVDMFNEEEKIILSVRPGITDWASVWNPDEGKILQASDDPDKTYLEKIRPEKIRLQIKYVQERSFWVDLKIIWETLKIVF
jgi:lipopolysaccharide/colanic/teichoic acid biosynthesis glycosyltransferase